MSTVSNYQAGGSDLVSVYANDGMKAPGQVVFNVNTNIASLFIRALFAQAESVQVQLVDSMNKVENRAAAASESRKLGLALQTQILELWGPDSNPNEAKPIADLYKFKEFMDQNGLTIDGKSFSQWIGSGNNGTLTKAKALQLQGVFDQSAQDLSDMNTREQFRNQQLFSTLNQAMTAMSTVTSTTGQTNSGIVQKY